MTDWRPWAFAALSAACVVVALAAGLAAAFSGTPPLFVAAAGLLGLAVLAWRRANRLLVASVWSEVTDPSDWTGFGVDGEEFEPGQFDDEFTDPWEEAADAFGNGDRTDESRGRTDPHESGRYSHDRTRATYAEREEGMTEREAYDVLGLDPDADAEAVREAYRERIKRAHPDTPAGSAEEFMRVREAYERLTEE